MDDKTPGGGYAIAGLLYMALGVIAGGIAWMNTESLVYGVGVTLGLVAIALPLLAAGRILGDLAGLRKEVDRLRSELAKTRS